MVETPRVHLDNLSALVSQSPHPTYPPSPTQQMNHAAKLDTGIETSVPASISTPPYEEHPQRRVRRQSCLVERAECAFPQCLQLF